MKAYLFAFLLSLLSFLGFSQNTYTFETQVESLFSSGERLPFWLTANQAGKYQLPESGNQHLSVHGRVSLNSIAKTPLNIHLGTRLMGNYSGQFKHQVNELYAKAFLWGWKLEGGLFQEPLYFDELSSSNGNIDRSNNARPYPRIRFGTDEYIPLFFLKKYVHFKAEYDEGILNDKRHVEGTRLHHKSLYLRGIITPDFNIAAGLNHYVQWAGNSPRHGELPGSKYYLTYVLGGVGTSAFPMTDQLNVAGNQFGAYYVEINFPFGNIPATFYISHPFDDHSGMELFNHEDNLYGLFIDLGKDQLFEKIMYEFMNTLDQSGHLHIIGVMTGRDDYFNHGVYQSGYTYSGRGMMTPLFAPLLMEDGKVIKNSNTRVMMHHFGFKGHINKQLSWDGKLTFSNNLGRYAARFNPSRRQFSSIVNLRYQTDKIPLNFSFSIATDIGKLYPNSLGGRLGIVYRL